MKLSIVLPAFNEEEAVGGVLEGCLRDAEHIKNEAGLDDVEVIVVNDGSTDRTQEIVRSYPDATLVNHEKNMGYGRALKTGFERASGELLAFLDADESCSPRMLAGLCRELLAQDADIAVGSRLGPESKMPKVRQLGNRLFATLLSVLSHRQITDSASGMRVLRRELLPMLMTLPDGLHFTPAMTSIASFEESVKMVEVPMPYSERAGASKLSVVRDGISFLRTIIGISLTYNPLVVFGSIGLVCCAVAAGLVLASMIQSGVSVPFLLTGAVAVFSIALSLVSLGIFSSYLVTLLSPSRVFSGLIGRHLIRQSVFSAFRVVGSVMLVVGLVLAAVVLLGAGRLAHPLQWALFVIALFWMVCGTQLAVLGLLMMLSRDFRNRKDAEKQVRAKLDQGSARRDEERLRS